MGKNASLIFYVLARFFLDGVGLTKSLISHDIYYKMHSTKSGAIDIELSFDLSLCMQ